MTVRIAVAGKGGTGKTAFSSLMVRNLVEKGKTPVLAIDAVRPVSTLTVENVDILILIHVLFGI